MDYTILIFINKFAGTRPWLDTAGIIFSDFLIYALPIIIFGVYFFSKKRRKIGSIVITIIASVILVAVVESAANVLVGRPRPFITHTEIYQLAKLFAPPTDYSFPSGHTALAFVMAFSVLIDWKKFGIILLIPALLIGISRIFAGVHWPTDILGGIVTAGIVVFMVEVIFFKLSLDKIFNSALIKIKRKNKQKEES